MEYHWITDEEWEAMEWVKCPELDAAITRITEKMAADAESPEGQDKMNKEAEAIQNFLNQPVLHDSISPEPLGPISGHILYSPLEFKSTGKRTCRGQEICETIKSTYFFRVYQRSESGEIIDYFDYNLDPETDIEIISDSVAINESKMSIDWNRAALGRASSADEISAKGARGKLLFDGSYISFVHNDKTYEWHCESVEVLKLEN